MRWKRHGETLWTRWLGLTLEVYANGRWRLSWMTMADGSSQEAKGQCRAAEGRSALGNAKVEVTREAGKVANLELGHLRGFYVAVVGGQDEGDTL